jgi:hypothetical protein
MINTGEEDVPLAPFELVDNDDHHLISGEDWEIDTLQPGECVGVYREDITPKVPSNVDCSPTGKTLRSSTRFWTDPVTIKFNGTPVASCPLEPSKCTIKTQQ